MTARHRVLDNLADRLRRAADNLVPTALDHLNEQRSYAPVVTAQDLTIGMHSTGGIPDPTWGTVVNLDQASYRARTINDYIATIELAVGHLEHECRTALAWRMEQTHEPDTSHLADTPLCIEPGCNQLPAVRTGRDGLTINDGRCLDCGRTQDVVQYARAAARLIQRVNGR